MNEKITRIPCSISSTEDHVEFIYYEGDALEIVLYDGEEDDKTSVVLAKKGIASFFAYINTLNMQMIYTNNIVKSKIENIENSIAESIKSGADKDEIIKDLTSKVQIMKKDLDEKTFELETIKVKHSKELLEVLNKSKEEIPPINICETRLNLDLNPTKKNTDKISFSQLQNGDVEVSFRTKYKTKATVTLELTQLRFMIRNLKGI